MNEQEFARVYEAYADVLFRHCFFRVSERERAKDFTQEAFVKTWEYLGQGKQIENMRAFLYRVADNLIIDESRKRKEMSLDALRESGDFLEPFEDGATKQEEGMILKEIHRTIATLDPSDRSLFVMRYIDELDPKEIAEALDMTPNNVSVKLHRIAKKIKEQL